MPRAKNPTFLAACVSIFLFIYCGCSANTVKTDLPIPTVILSPTHPTSVTPVTGTVTLTETPLSTNPPTEMETIMSTSIYTESEIQPTDTPEGSSTNISTNNESATVVSKIVGTVRLFSSLTNPDKSMLDLDTGNVTGLGDLDADVEYFASIGSSVFYFIRTVNNATGYYFSDEPPTIENCLEHLEDFSEISVANYQADMICILTNNGQLSFLMYEREGADWGEYTYSTWNR